MTARFAPLASAYRPAHTHARENSGTELCTRDQANNERAQRESFVHMER